MTISTSQGLINETTQRSHSRKKLVILLIENSVELRAFFSGAIKKSVNFDVLTAGSANDAKQNLIDNYENINFILFNWISPNVSGSIFAQSIMPPENCT